MKINDAVFGLLLLILGAAILITIRNYPSIPGQNVGPALFPGLIATGLCLGGLILMVRGWRTRASVPWFELQDWAHSPRHVIGLLVLVASVVFYIQLSEQLGFLLCATLILASLFYVLRVPLGKSLLIAVVASFLVHFAFYKLLRVPLPWGLLINHSW